MTTICWKAVALLAAAPLAAQTKAPQLTGFPFTDEALKYSLNMPGGPKLGEGHLRARKVDTGWSFELTLDAPVPVFEVHDSYVASASSNYCAVEFTKKFQHGKRNGSEKETIDRAHSSVVRTTVNGGGKSEFSVPDCVKDALTLLMYTRKEMGQGRVPAAQRVLFGAMYDAQLTYTGAETVTVAGKEVQADRVVCVMKGPKSNVQIEMLLARDAARTPLQFKLPLAVGSFSLELIR